ncbi:hypothetical protein ABC382_00830 [Lysinibacillus sp. 1P01SD]|uniref:hypothetical protein n=1 Tax=Lysinibacillus sp. 1P01SD TaxID=3132285 RepID=UPI0039A35B11
MLEQKLFKIYNISSLQTKGQLSFSEVSTFRIRNSLTVDDCSKFINVPLSYQELEILVAYFIFKVEALHEESTLLPVDITTLLTQFYKCVLIEKPISYECVQTIDIYDNREIWLDCFDDILELDFLSLNNQEIERYFKTIAKEIREAQNK